MKRLLFLSVLGIFMAFQVSAQDNTKVKDKDVPQVVQDKDVPQAIKTTFDNQFAGATMVEWKLKHGNYKAMFTKDNKKQSAEFSSAGELISKGEKIEQTELPAAVSDAIKTSYASSTVGEVYRIDKGGQIQYLVKLEGNDKKKLVFDAQGKEVMKEKMDK
jgi:putative PepSY-like beta-lactamase-inhibitor